MKHFITLLLAASMLPLAAAHDYQIEPASPRSVKLSKITLPMVTAGKVQFSLYVPAKSSKHIKAGAAKFAEYLSQLTGTKINAVSKLPADKKTTVLRFGDADLAKANKIDLAKIDRHCRLRQPDTYCRKGCT